MIFAIGDIHGYYKRLEALLRQENLITESSDEKDPTFFNGFVRDRKDVVIVQLGDFIHADKYSKDRDLETIQAVSKWCDYILWGNHDRAVVDNSIAFSGYDVPHNKTIEIMKNMVNDKKLLLAYNADGTLLTHAGLQEKFKKYFEELEDITGDDAESLVKYLNSNDLMPFNETFNESAQDVRFNIFVNQISYTRGGPDEYGGILWRDIREELYPGFRQVFGHSVNHDRSVSQIEQINPYTGKTFYSFGIDVGGRQDTYEHNWLAGLYLPERKFVRVNSTRFFEENIY